MKSRCTPKILNAHTRQRTIERNPKVHFNNFKEIHINPNNSMLNSHVLYLELIKWPCIFCFDLDFSIYAKMLEMATHIGAFSNLTCTCCARFQSVGFWGGTGQDLHNNYMLILRLSITLIPCFHDGFSQLYDDDDVPNYIGSIFGSFINQRGDWGFHNTTHKKGVHKKLSPQG